MQVLSCFLTIPQTSDFSIYNLPYGVFSHEPHGERRIGVAIGEYVLDLTTLEANGLLGLEGQYFNHPTLNAFIGSGKANWQQLRNRLQQLLSADNATLRDDEALRQQVLINQADVTLHLPIEVPGYTDFYSSKEHATNVGTMFRDPNHALLPNWSELPVGYNGRASSVVVSGVDIVRPSGQIKLPDHERPIFSACRKLDFELETGFIVGKPNQLGQPIAIEDAWEHIFGMVLLNDWSARDIQQWEYVPLGPFNAKTFASSISPWVVTMAALEPFKTHGPRQEPRPLAYLREETRANSYDINLSVALKPQNSDTSDVICQTNFNSLYWSMAQQLTHHTIAGCNVRVGDLMGSGTISGPTPQSFGSMLELAWNGTKPLMLSHGDTRCFIEDGDTITMTGYCEKDGIRVGFGEVRGQVLPAINFQFTDQ